jgi:pyruvate/2-oxoglutarate dehydrogenase complex dihydrolipoamide dehydrogenase (E3) component
LAQRFDAVIVGAGPGGGGAALELAAGGMRVALCERELLGGECPYWACMPSKALLRPPEVRSEARRAAGLGEPGQDFAAVAAHRDRVIHYLDDSKKAKAYDERGIAVYRGEATIADRGHVEVDGQALRAERIVIATGAPASIPPIEGLEDAGCWTNREATTFSSVPESVVVLGGGPVGIELGQALRRFGSRVTLVEAADHLMSREEPRIGELAAEALVEDGVDIRLASRAEAVSREGDGLRTVTLSDGEEVSGAELLVAVGREPRTQGLGLERVGVELGARGEVMVDERLRAADGVWAVGDVTGILPFTHAGAYQARVAAGDMLEEDVRADYRAIPRVVFSDPEIASVGLSAAQARDEGIDVDTVRVELPDAIGRPITYEQKPRGQELELVADRERGVLVGAWAVAPLAGEWIRQAAMAIKLRAPLEVLRDTVSQFPTFCEGFTEGVRLFGR